jgi:hydroxymethylpyrimidine pyrophosphatase-like HAD family hydrolase
VGDVENNTTLFEAVGFRVAMANGAPELIEAANVIALHVDEDGFAQLVEYYTAYVRSVRETPDKS